MAVTTTKKWKRSEGSENGEGIFQHSLCRILIYLLTSISLMLSIIIVINHFSHATIGEEKHLQGGHSHYHDLNREEYEILYKHAKMIINKHRTQIQSDIKKSTTNDPATEEDSGKVEGLGEQISSEDPLTRIAQGGGLKKIKGNNGIVSNTRYPSTARDMVLGLAENIDPKNFAVFCKSLRSVSTAQAFIFVNTPIDSRIKSIADTSQVKLVGYDKKRLSSYLESYHPSSLRWILFADFFKRKDKYRIIFKRCFLLDVRDSYFQRDPFEFVNPELTNFHIFNGVETITIEQCGWNGGWVKSCFGERMLRQIGHNHIICSGVSVGTMDVVYEYINIVKEIMNGGKGLSQDVKQNYLKLGQSPILFPQCERNGVDQGVHNVIIYNGYLEKLFETNKESLIKQWNQKDTPVCNMQAKVCQIRNSQMDVINTKGEIVHVVHQYDRFPELQKVLFSKYVDWINTNDLDAEWKAEPACSSFIPEKDVDLFKGRCDLSARGGATSAVSCCRFCDSTANCEGFTYVSGQCFLKSCGESQARKNILVGAVSGYRKSN